MRAVFINSCHPDIEHVCGLRARSFAEALAEAGHRIVLLTPPLEETGNGTDAGALAALLRTHDWSRPCRIVAPFKPGTVLPDLRTGNFPAGLRHAMIGWHFLRHGNIFEDWCSGARPLLPVIAENIRPDVVWAVFGHTGCWRVAQELAGLGRCPWVADVKDPWDAFVPAPLRGHVARRFRDAARMTALSAAHAAMVRRRLPGLSASVVHSGIAREFLPTAHDSDAGDTMEKEILLSGSIYDAAALETAFSTLARWLGRPRPEGPAAAVHVAYAGADGERVAAAARRLEGRCRLDLLGRLPLDRLHARQRRAALNLHLYFAPVLFHHKLIELFAAGRPVLAYPGESAEARAIAAEIGARLICCGNPEELERALSEILGESGSGPSRPDHGKLAQYGWEAQATRLLDALRQAADTGRG